MYAATLVATSSETVFIQSAQHSLELGYVLPSMLKHNLMRENAKDKEQTGQSTSFN